MAIRVTRPDGPNSPLYFRLSVEHLITEKNVRDWIRMMREINSNHILPERTIGIISEVSSHLRVHGSMELMSIPETVVSPALPGRYRPDMFPILRRHKHWIDFNFMLEAVPRMYRSKDDKIPNTSLGLQEDLRTFLRNYGKDPERWPSATSELQSQIALHNAEFFLQKLI
jgi:hypothetical protein